MEHIHNKLIKLGGWLRNVSKIEKKLVIKTRRISDFSPFSRALIVKNGLTTRNLSSFIGTLPSDPPNLIKLFQHVLEIRIQLDTDIHIKGR
jgi:hypothetical protein